MIDDKLLAGLGALIFAAVAAFGIKTGRFKTREFKADPYMRRRQSPIAFWLYAVLLIVGAVFLAYIAIFVA
ncbi:MAG TPA: hypothetical protein VFR52_02075 [Sphingomicrobium sp.]|nr:hypothetical protein [Sphingomicrobium sp.]